MRVPAVAEQVPRLRRAVQDFVAECDGLAVPWFAIALSLTEACSNVVRHAYPNGDGEICLTVEIDDQHLIIEITDDGVGLDARSPTKGQGLGLTIMSELAETRITSGGQGTRVQLSFPRQPDGRD